MELRYYGDSSLESDHTVVVGLLGDVHERWDVPVTVERVRRRHGSLEEFPGPVREVDADAAYERDFADNPLLAANVGTDPEEAWCTENGLPTIAGCVGIVDPGADPDGGALLLWATTLSGDPPSTDLFSPDAYSVGFLERVREEGPEVLEHKCTTAEDVTPPGRLAGDDAVPDDLALEADGADPAAIVAGETDTAPTGDRDRRGDTRSGTAADAGTGTDAETGAGAGATPDRSRSLDVDADAGERRVDALADADAALSGATSGYVTGDRTAEDLVAEFVADSPPTVDAGVGDIRHQVTVGELPATLTDRPPADRSIGREFATRTADAVVHADRHWVVETTGRLSAMELDRAVGAVVVAETLYRRQEDLDEGETVRAVLFDTVARDTDVEETVAMLRDTLAYAAAAGVELFVRDPSLNDGQFRCLTDYGSTPASVSSDSRAV